ncbi:MAG: AAA family ATPase [Flavobacteriales bacterium]|nr:AAA family ATPase [Flavobacteriales bacterium]
MMEVYSKKDVKKFTKSIKIDDYEILTDEGFVDIEFLHETIPYEVWNLKLSNGYELDCADDHIIFDSEMNEVFVKDLIPGDRISTDDGISTVLSVLNTLKVENMYDFELSESSNRRYYTNGILSHNTEMAKQLAKYLFDSEDALIRLDMSEYMEKIDVNKLLGSAAGYVGFEEGSAFLNKVRTKPYSVILLDEIEKANPEIFNVFLQMLDDGQLTDSHGRKINFKNCVILMTSNVGTRVIKDFGGGVGFSTKSKEESNSSDMKSILEKELKKKFAPEFINRIDDIIYFKDLTKEDIGKIVDIELIKSVERLKVIGFDAIIEDSLKEQLIESGYDPQYGARPLKRAIQRLVDDCLTDTLLEEPMTGSLLSMSFNKDENKTVITVKKPKKKPTKGEKGE